MLRAVVFFTALIASSAFAESPEDLFQKGLAAYQNKQFEDARESFQTLVSQGYKSPGVLHNLALTYFQLEKKPFAVALWRKALAIDPSYRLATAGRSVMETQFNMRPFERERVRLELRRWLESVSLYELSWLIAFLLAGCGWVWIRYFAGRRAALDEELPLPPFPVAGLVLSIFLLGAFGLAALKLQLQSAVRGTVLLNQVAARSLPADDAVSLFELAGGSEVILRRKNEGWFQVQNSEGMTGWVKTDELMITSGTEL